MRPVAVFLLVAMTACGSDLDPLGMWWTFGNHEPVAMYRRVGNRTTGGIEGGALWLREGEGQALRDGQEVSALWPVLEVGQAGVPRSPRTDAFAQCVAACRNCRRKGEQTAEGVGRVLLRRISVKGLPQGEPLCAEAHGAIPQQEEPAVLPT